MKTQSFKLGTVAAACVASLAFAAQVQADPVDFLPAGSTVQFKYNNFEIVVDEVGDVLNGIFTVTSIGNVAGSELYWATGLSDGTQLNGTFQDLTVAQIVDTGSGFNIWFTGGSLTFYNVASGSYNPTGPGDSTASQLCGGACPAPWLTMDFVPGIAPDQGDGGFDESTATLFSTVSALTSPLTGTGDGFLEITGGTAASAFVADGWLLQSNLESCPGSANCDALGDPAVGDPWPLASFDPLVGQTASVPEPATLALMGLGLLGLGMGLRRRKV